MNILMLILWLVIGMINIATAAYGGEISIISYVCCWVLLLIHLVRDCLDYY